MGVLWGYSCACIIPTRWQLDGWKWLCTGRVCTWTIELLVLFVPKNQINTHLHYCFCRLLLLEPSKFTALSPLVLCSVGRNRWLRFATLLVYLFYLLLIIVVVICWDLCAPPLPGIKLGSWWYFVCLCVVLHFTIGSSLTRLYVICSNG